MTADLTSLRDRLTPHEIEVLRMMTGEREGEWGAWVSACLGFLSGAGLCTRGPNYQITDDGRALLAALQSGGER